MKYLIIMLLALVLTTQTMMAEETKTTTQEEFTDISWEKVSKVEKVNKIIGRITILRMLNVVPVEFWKEFGLDLDKETLDWEKTDGIDLDMVLSAHEEKIADTEADLLNKKKSFNSIYGNKYDTNNGESSQPIGNGSGGASDGTVTSKDVDNINGIATSGDGTTYKEGYGGVTASELAAASTRIEVIKNEYGLVCNEAGGEGCNAEVVGDYNADPLKNGDAVTNPVEGKL